MSSDLCMLAERIRSQAAISSRPGQLAALEEIADRLDTAAHDTDLGTLTLARVADELGCTRDQLDLWFARGVVTERDNLRVRVRALEARIAEREHEEETRNAG